MNIKGNKIIPSLTRRSFIRSATLLLGGACIFPTMSFENVKFSDDFSNEKLDYLCCMQLTYNMSINARLRRETSELYGNLENDEYRKKLVDMYYIPNSEVKINGKSYFLSSKFAQDLAERSGSNNAEEVVANILALTAMKTSFATIEATPTLKSVNSITFSMEEQNTLIQILWKMAFNQEMSEEVVNAKTFENKFAALRTIETDSGFTLSTSVAKTIAEYLVQENYSELSGILGNNIYAASW